MERLNSYLFIILIVCVVSIVVVAGMYIFYRRKIKHLNARLQNSKNGFTTTGRNAQDFDLNDFRDPVSVIAGYSQKLMVSLSNSESSNSLTVINENAKKLLSIIDGIDKKKEDEFVNSNKGLESSAIEMSYDNSFLSYDEDAEELDKTRERILIVDDDYSIRYFIKNMLQDHYQVIEAADGRQGLEKTIKSLPDLVISDIIMPELDGIDLCRKIKTDIKTSHIPVILLTGRSAIENRIKGFEVGADYYISKPFNSIELMLRVKNLLETLQNQRKRYAGDIFQTPRQLTSNSTDEKFLSDVIRYVEDNIENPDLDISVLASELSMSSSNLYRKIKSITGMSSIDFVMNHKMKYAAHLLLSNKHSVKAVAYMVGFTDSRYFSTRFKKYFNSTPTEYKERFLEEKDVKNV